MDLNEALYGLENGSFVESISMSQALYEIDNGISILNPFTPSETDALIELYGYEQMQLFIKRENKRIKKERKELKYPSKMTKIFVNLFA